MDILKWMNPILHIRRSVLRITQGDMGRIAGVSQATISRWESGRNEPSLEHLRRIRAEVRRRRLSWDERWLYDASAGAAA